jgi:hypothetical protein
MEKDHAPYNSSDAVAHPYVPDRSPSSDPTMGSKTPGSPAKKNEKN